MKLLGLDIGTTTVSAVVMENGRVLSSVTRESGAAVPSAHPWEKPQDADKIRLIALSAVEELFVLHPDTARIGLTGQMHGILYLDASGTPVSPLYTWQDGRGELSYDGERTYARALSDITGYPLSTGYGLVTHFYNAKNGLVPKNAAIFCTIHDYIAMLLAGKTRPVTDRADAASLGLFDVEKGAFDFDAMERAGINPAMLPAVTDGPWVGLYRDGVPVHVPTGDNQASFLGAAGGDLTRVLANIGTGSQLSVYTPDFMTVPGLETRPFPGGGYLLAGSALCGGRAYALLEQFFRDTGKMLGLDRPSCYDAMAALLENAPRPEDIPTVSPLFQGTRENPTLRGSITGLTTENFTPLHLICGLLNGMAQELKVLYDRYLAAGGAPLPLTGSGNGLRKNPYLQKCFAEVFGTPLTMSDTVEEAAVGAAILAGRDSVT